jgi:DNA polymerase-3 subunit delta
MTGKKEQQTYATVMRDLRAGIYAPVYYLMGEEDYYIDRISDYIENNILSDDEKGFNLIVAYGADTDMPAILTMARRYPMMAERQIVVVKEAQALDAADELLFYLQKPVPTTILVFCHKHGTLDKRKKLAGEIARVGVLLESPRLNERDLPPFIAEYLRERHADIGAKAAAMLTDFVGSDLSRLTGELDKLLITLPQGDRTITDEQIERNIGVSKEFNSFELRNAIIAKDIRKANLIVKHFAENPKAYPIQMVLPLLFNFFANLMLAYYAPEKSEQGVAAMLGLRSPWQARDYLSAMRMFSGVKVMQIISDIRYTDARSKGVGNSSVGGGELLRELVFKILH